MTDEHAPVRRHVKSAKEHLAGLAAAKAWHQELSAAHLLRTQQPIHETPLPPEQEGQG